jgi:hypothetical protein
MPPFDELRDIVCTELSQANDFETLIEVEIDAFAPSNTTKVGSPFTIRAGSRYTMLFSVAAANT